MRTAVALLLALALMGTKCSLTAPFTLSQALAITQSQAGPLPIQLVVTNAAEAAAAREIINQSACQGVDVLLDGVITYDFDIYPRDCPQKDSLHTRFRQTPGSLLVGGIRAACDDLTQPERAHCAAVSIEGVVASALTNDAFDASSLAPTQPGNQGKGALVVTIGAWADVEPGAIASTNVITGHGRSRFLSLNTGGFTYTTQPAPTAPFTENTLNVVIGGVYVAGLSRFASAYHVGGGSGGLARGQAFGTAFLCQTPDAFGVDIEPGTGGHTFVGLGPGVVTTCSTFVDETMGPNESYELVTYAPGEAVPLEVPLPPWITGRRVGVLVLR